MLHQHYVATTTTTSTIYVNLVRLKQWRMKLIKETWFVFCTNTQEILLLVNCIFFNFEHFIQEHLDRFFENICLSVCPECTEATFGHWPQPGLPDFSWHNIPKRGKIYLIATKLPNGHKIYQHFSFQDPPKVKKLWFFGLKMYHLASLTTTTRCQKTALDTFHRLLKNAPKFWKMLPLEITYFYLKQHKRKGF
jgi:hypothetical protein